MPRAGRARGGAAGADTLEISAGAFHGEGLQILGSRRLSPPRPRRGVRGSSGSGRRLRGLRGTGAVPGGPLRVPPGCCWFLVVIVTIVFRLLVFGDLAEISFAPDRKVWGSPRCPGAAWGPLPALSLIKNRSDAVNVGVF